MVVHSHCAVNGSGAMPCTRSTTTTRCRPGACRPMAAWRTSMREDLCIQLLPAGRATLRRGVAVAMVVGLLSAGRASEVQAPSAAAPAPAAPPLVIGLGQPLSPADIDRYAITVFPNGRNLPPGRGSVEQGARLYAMHCAACHGAQGIEGPAARLAGTDGFIGWRDPRRPVRWPEEPLPGW